MTALVARAETWFFLQAATFPDTVVMKQAATERGWLETATGVASVVTTAALVTLTVILAGVSWTLWRSFRRYRKLLDQFQAGVAPITGHARNVADNLDYITTSIRSDVQQVNATIASANRRLQQAVEVTESRLNEFNALLHVVQQEAEQAFVTTAAAVRGVRKGAASLGRMSARTRMDSAPGGEADGNDSDSDEVTPRNSERSGAGNGPRDTSSRPRVRSSRRRRD